MDNKIDMYFRTLVEMGGSDLHLSEGQPPKVRVHGDISPIEDHILTHEDMVELMQPICNPKLWEQYVNEGDADFAYEMDEHSRFRCNYMKQQRGYCCVFRLIPTDIMTLEQLNIPSSIQAAGVDKAEFEAEAEAMAEAALADRCTATNPRPCSKEEILQVFHKAYIGRLP